MLDKNWTFTPRAPLRGGFYRIVTEVALNGKPYDRLDNGFFVWDESIVKDAPKYELKDNVFCVNGRPTYMPGADMHGSQINRWMDGPLCWYSDARRCVTSAACSIRHWTTWSPWDLQEPRMSLIARDSGHSPERIPWPWHAGRQVYSICHVSACWRYDPWGKPGKDYDEAWLPRRPRRRRYYRGTELPEAIQYYIGGDINVADAKEALAAG